MIKRSRRMRRNFSDEKSVATQAVATANLVSILDPIKIDADGVELIADATGTQEEFVENLTSLVDEANEAVGTIDEAEVIQNYSNKVRGLCSKAKLRKNFADEQVSEEQKITDAAEIVSMVDDEALDTCESKEIAETISEATGANVDAVEAIVDVAKENFSAGMKYAQKKQRKINRQNFAHIHFNANMDEVPAPTNVDPESATPAPQRPKVEPKTDDPVVDSGLPKTGSEGLKQNPDLAENDPTPDTAVADLSAAPAGEAMAVQNELATVQGVTDVPEASSNFSRTHHQNSAKDDDFSTLKSILGKDYVA